MNYANLEKMSLSFTGHSLGAFLAELSVFYCHTLIKLPSVKGVTFDGPGTKNIMEKMCHGMIEGAGASWSKLIQELDITRYTAQPNLVNSTNQHIGVTYCLDPQIDEKMLKEGFSTSLGAVIIAGSSSLDPNKKKGAKQALRYIYSHTLSFQLACFNHLTGRPDTKDMRRVKNWPLLKYTGPPKNKTQSTLSFLHTMKRKLENILGGSKQISSEAFSEETSTLGSLFQVLSLRLHDQIDVD